MAPLELASPEQPMCAWTEASEKFAIHVCPEIIARLGTDSWVAFKRVPRRGLEIGGILLGHTDTQDGVTNFWIEGFLPVESEHRSGPSYLLSESDFGRLQNELSKNRSACVGIYRSQTRSEQLAPQPPDVEWFDRCFDSNRALFLMLGPVPGVAAFFTRSGGNLKCVHEFPLASSLSSMMTQRQPAPSPQVRRPVQLAAEARDIPGVPAQAPVAQEAGSAPPETQSLDLSAVHPVPPETNPTPEISSARSDSSKAKTALRMRSAAGQEVPHAVPAGVPPPIPHSIDGSPGSKAPGNQLRNGKWILAAAAMCMAAIAVSLLIRSPARSSPSVAPAASRSAENLHLTVQRSGSLLRLLWDRDSPAIRGATRAVLHIQDGDVRNDRQLSPSELGSGSTTYEPKSSELTFRLDVYSADPDGTGSLQVMNLSPGPPAPGVPAIEPVASSTAPRRRNPEPLVQAIAQTEVKRSQPVSVAPIAKTAFPEDPATPESGTAEKSDRLKDEVRAVASNSPAVPPVSAQPPAVARTADSSVIERKAPVALSGSDRAPSVWISSEAVSGSRIGQFAGKIPLLRRFRKSGNATPPVPVYQAQPLLRISEKSLDREVLVDVKIYVGESGAVYDAEVTGYGDPQNLGLANAALAAARRWTFVPARTEDVAVSSEVLLHFHFNP